MTGFVIQRAGRAGETDEMHITVISHYSEGEKSTRWTVRKTQYTKFESCGGDSVGFVVEGADTMQGDENVVIDGEGVTDASECVHEMETMCTPPSVLRIAFVKIFRHKSINNGDVDAEACSCYIEMFEPQVNSVVGEGMVGPGLFV